MDNDWSMPGGFLALLLFGGLASTMEASFRAGRRWRNEAAAEQLGTIQGAVFGLLGLLLGFSFSAASDRFSDRAHLIADEANAIATAWSRADLMSGDPRKELRAALRFYVAERADSITH